MLFCVKKDISSMINMLTLLHCSRFALEILSSFPFKNAASWIVVPPNNEAAAPVVAVNRNVSSFQGIDTARQNSKQNLSAIVTQVDLPAPANPVKNIISCECPPSALN